MIEFFLLRLQIIISFNLNIALNIVWMEKILHIKMDLIYIPSFYLIDLFDSKLVKEVQIIYQRVKQK